MVRIIHAAQFPRRVHGKQRCAHIKGPNAEPGGCQWPNGGAAGNSVIGDKLLVRGPGFRTQSGPHRCPHTVSGIALIRIDLQQRAAVEHGQVDGIVALTIVGVDSMPGIGRDTERAGEGSAAFALAGTQSVRDTGQDIF